MTHDEFTILQIADAIRDRRKWELCIEVVSGPYREYPEVKIEQLNKERYE